MRRLSSSGMPRSEPSARAASTLRHEPGKESTANQRRARTGRVTQLQPQLAKRHARIDALACGYRLRCRGSARGARTISRRAECTNLRAPPAIPRHVRARRCQQPTHGRGVATACGSIRCQQPRPVRKRGQHPGRRLEAAARAVAVAGLARRDGRAEQHECAVTVGRVDGVGKKCVEEDWSRRSLGADGRCTTRRCGSRTAQPKSQSEGRQDDGNR